MDAVAVHDATSGTLTLFALNRTPEPRRLVAPLRDLGTLRMVARTVLSGPDLDAGNAANDPDRVRPAAGGGALVDGGTLTVTVPGHSWSVIRLGA